MPENDVISSAMPYGIVAGLRHTRGTVRGARSSRALSTPIGQGSISAKWADLGAAAWAATMRSRHKDCNRGWNPRTAALKLMGSNQESQKTHVNIES